MSNKIIQLNDRRRQKSSAANEQCRLDHEASILDALSDGIASSVMLAHHELSELGVEPSYPIIKLMTHHAYRYGVWENPTLLTMAAILLESQRCLGEGLLDHEAPDAAAMKAIEGSFLQFAKHVAIEEIEHEALGEMVLYGLLNTLNKHLSINMDHLFGPSAGPAKSPSLN